MSFSFLIKFPKFQKGQYADTFRGSGVAKLVAHKFEEQMVRSLNLCADEYFYLKQIEHGIRSSDHQLP
jgi:hypothetical protein